MVHSEDFYRLYQTTYEKYRDLYGQKVCVFLQKGSFYEIYGQQNPNTGKHLNTGKEILECMDIVIHTYLEDGPNKTTGYYGGVPIYVLDKWASKLTKQGWTVVVIDEVKNGAGKVSKREVSKVLSAGTHLEAAEFGHLHCISALWLECTFDSPPRFGVATSDLTTGQVFVYEGQATGKSDTWHTDDLRHFFQVYPPKELLVFLRNSTYSYEEDWIRRTFYIPTAPIHIRTIQDQGNLDSSVTRAEYLQRLFQPKSALPIRTWLRCAPDGSSLYERALCSLLRFAEDHSPTLVNQLQAPHIWHPTQNLQIINNALTQLNLIGSTGDQMTVEDLFIKPLTAMGKRNLSARLCSPLADANQIKQRQMEIDWILHSSKSKQEEIHACLSEIYDMSRLHRSLVRGTICAADVLQLYTSYMSSQFLWKALKGSPFLEGVNEIFSRNIQSCLEEFEKLFDVKKAKKAEERQDELGFLHSEVGPLCAETETQIQTVYEKAEAWLQGLRALCTLDPKAITYKPTEKTMFLIHATKTALKQIESSLKRLSVEEKGPYKTLNLKQLTSSGRVDHEDLDKLQEELDMKKLALSRAMRHEVPKACIQYVLKTRDCWQQLEEWITHIDLSLSMAKTAKQQGWIQPTIVERTDTDPSYIRIENLRHPLIENQKRQSKLVTHTIQLGNSVESGSGWLLYGMNASGKSSLMKAIGLAVLLSQIGSYVPATAMTIRPFKRIATRILNQDNLWAGLSSFAVEMSELREILTMADHQTLVLGDELCAGTESLSGTSIVAAGIQHLSKAGARFVLATHLHDLMKLPEICTLPTLRIWHLHVEYDPIKDILIYHRSLRAGSGSSQYGLEVAKALHLPRDMIEAAFAFRHQLLGETTVENAPISRWNSDITRLYCSSCKTPITNNLEVHHIQERAKAKKGRNEDGTSLNHMRNLAVLCQVCHDKEHSNQISVGPVEDTSEGPRRKIVELSQFEYRPDSTSNVNPVHSKPTGKPPVRFTKEELDQLKTARLKYTALEPRLLRFQIQAEYGIEVDEKELRALIKKGYI